MRSVGLLVRAAVTAACVAVASAAFADTRTDAPDAPTCQARDGGLGHSRVVEIDTTAGPLFGDITSEVKEASFLKPKEVVLTFDDGPMPWVTSSILDTLDKFCTRATFFAVGKMAVAYPSMLRKIVQRGHTLGGHTWSHPLNLKRLDHDKAMAEIDKGMAAISLSSGGQAAPFFRFPGLSDNAKMLTALQARGIASFTVDVVSDDSYISNPAKLVATTLSRVEARKGGILLFHDIKPATAKALPVILAELKKSGYSVVHMRSKTFMTPLADYAEQLKPVLAKKDPPQGQAVAKAAMMPFFGAIGPEHVERSNVETGSIVVQTIAPEPRDRNNRTKAQHAGTGVGSSEASKTGGKATPGSSEPSKASGKAPSAKPKSRERDASEIPSGEAVTLRGFPAGDKWSAQVRRERLNRTLYD